MTEQDKKFTYTCKTCGITNYYCSKPSMFVGKSRHLKTKKHLKKVEEERKERLTKETGMILTEPSDKGLVNLIDGYSKTNRITSKIAETVEQRLNNLTNLVNGYKEQYKELRESARRKEALAGTIRNQLQQQVDHLTKQTKAQQKQIEQLTKLFQSNHKNPVQSYPILPEVTQTRDPYPKQEPKPEPQNELVATSPITPEPKPEVEMWQGEPLYNQSVRIRPDPIQKEDDKEVLTKAIEAVKTIRERQEKIEKAEQSYPNLQELKDIEKEIEELKEQMRNPELTMEETAAAEEELKENRVYLKEKQEEYKAYISNETYWDTQLIKGKMEEVVQYEEEYGVNLLTLDDDELDELLE